MIPDGTGPLPLFHPSPMHRTHTDPTRRFSDRVENYVRYRPGYPEEVVHLLRTETGLAPAAVIADVGSGTGISSELFLRHGHTVHGVEPNREMREAAEAMLREHPRFHSVPGTAEATTLPPRSVDCVVAGQAFHWFDTHEARREFARILRPGGWVVLLWNTRRTDSTPFLRAYEALLQRHGTDYREVQHRNVDPAALRSFFANGAFGVRTLYNEQRFEFEGLKGRLLSSSYVPAEEHPGYPAMMRTLEHLFEEHAEDGRVCFEYDTELYFGHVA